MTESAKALAWDGEIDDDGQGFVLLPDGVYPFRVVKVERMQFKGSAKLPPCPQAALVIEVDGGPAGVATLRHNLFLTTKTSGFLCEFFRAIGQRAHGQKYRMDWGKVPGATGTCKVVVEPYEKRDGTVGQSNKIVRFLDPGTRAPAQVTHAAPAEAKAVEDELPF